MAENITGHKGMTPGSKSRENYKNAGYIPITKHPCQQLYAISMGVSVN
jgi:hypothetical protein